MPTVRTGAVQVSGLVELNRALKGMDKDLARELRGANKDAASIVAARSVSRARSLGGVAAHVADSIKAAAGATSAGVAIGNTAHPEAAGAEFGSVRFKQFKPWTGNGGDAGYFVYPTIREDDHEWLQPYEDAVNHLTKRAGLA